MDFEIFIKTKCKCCITEKPLADSAHINMIQLEFRPSWKFPVANNVIYNTGVRAVAFVHDDCIVNGKLQGEIKFAVEFKNNNIIYHSVPEIQRCRVCGCYDLDACIHPVHGNCFWIEKDLCSHCKNYPGEAKRHSQMIRETEEEMFGDHESLLLHRQLSNN